MGIFVDRLHEQCQVLVKTIFLDFFFLAELAQSGQKKAKSLSLCEHFRPKLIGAPFTSANSNHCLKKTLNNGRITRHIRVHLGKTITPQIPIHILRCSIVSLSGQQHFDIENTKLIFKSHGM